jgi:hypothetical protein
MVGCAGFGVTMAALTRWTGVVLLLTTVACGNITRKQEDGGIVPDDAAVDDAVITPDAPDEVAAPTESREVVSGGAKLTGATYTFEVQVGHGIDQRPATGATYTLEGNAAVKP